MNSNGTTSTQSPEPFWAPVVIRLATAGDQPSLERLAQLDSARVPVGQTVLGELQGRPLVAVSLADGSAIADPFSSTAEILELVRLRAEQLSPGARSGHAPPERRWSKAPGVRSKRDESQIGSFLPMYRRLAQLILRAA